MTSNSETTQVALDTRIGEYTVDEYGERDDWDRGGVYGPDGEFDLGRTKELLADRFEKTRERLPETVGDYEKVKDSQIRVWYQREAEGVTETVRIFPVGPQLHEWTVAVEDRDEDGHGGWRWLEEAAKLDNPEDAADAALGYMGGETA